jgi:phenylalanyl-tRNA synthetase alpha chain
MGGLSKEDRPVFGQKINQLKSCLETQCGELLNKLEASHTLKTISKDAVDVTLPPRMIPVGNIHPITKTLNHLIDVFTGMGFSVYEGPDVETDWYNFEALNVPKDHPARDMQDTFYIDDERLLRTHTSPVQIRVMEKNKPPIFMIAPGSAYRRDTPDLTHSPIFKQVEGLMVDERITFGDLKGVLTEFVHKVFGEKTSVRFRPSFFPFTEPSAEMEIQCVMCKGKGCRVCKDTGWLEILGCGMVDPAVFESVGYDPKKLTGFAFGMGVERIAMLKYNISDIRLFYENNIKFLEQF